VDDVEVCLSFGRKIELSLEARKDRPFHPSRPQSRRRYILTKSREMILCRLFGDLH